MPFVSFDMMSYAAGLSRLHAWRFALATLAGLGWPRCFGLNRHVVIHPTRMNYCLLMAMGLGEGVDGLLRDVADLDLRLALQERFGDRPADPGGPGGDHDLEPRGRAHSGDQAHFLSFFAVPPTAGG